MSKKQNRYRKPFQVGQLTTHKRKPQAPHLSGFWLVLDLEWFPDRACWGVLSLRQQTGQKVWFDASYLRAAEENDD